jgi:SAM-dependent methyltransferase
VGVEPHPDLVAVARRRVRRLEHVRVLQGTAQKLPVTDASVDLAHARWAYFFGPGCEPGLRELARVVRRGGAAVVIDHDPSRGTFGNWFRRGYPHVPPAAAVERFWSTQGWARMPVPTRWDFSTRADFEAVVGIEFPGPVARQILDEHPGTEVDYAVNVWWRRF